MTSRSEPRFKATDPWQAPHFGAIDGDLITRTERVVRFAVAAQAAPQGSKRHVGHGVMVESSKHVAPFRAIVHLHAQQAMAAARQLIRTGEVVVSLRFIFPRAASHLTADGKRAGHDYQPEHVKSGAPIAPGHQAGDIDKLERAVLDGITGACYVDDSQVAGLFATKGFGPTACVWIDVREVIR